MPPVSNIVGTICCSTATNGQCNIHGQWAVQHSGEIGSATFRGTDLCCAAGEAKSTEGITEKRDACWKSLSNDLASVISEAVQQLPLP
jgi:hypothetical protein